MRRISRVTATGLITLSILFATCNLNFEGAGNNAGMVRGKRHSISGSRYLVIDAYADRACWGM